MLNELISETNTQIPIVACVNGEEVTLTQMVRQMGVADNLAFFDLFARQILIRQLAEKEGIVVSAESLQDKVDEWRYQRKLEQVEDTEVHLMQRGITLQDVVEDVTFKRLEYLLSVHVTAGKIESYFMQNKLDFDMADVCWIFVKDEDVAEELFLQISEDGADFYALARRYSSDEATRASSGYLGRLRRKQLPKGIASRVFASDIEKIVGPEKVVGGYALYMLQNFYPAKLNTRVQKEIRKRLFNQWLQRELRQADITYPIREIKLI